MTIPSDYSDSKFLTDHSPQTNSNLYQPFITPRVCFRNSAARSMNEHEHKPIGEPASFPGLGGGVLPIMAYTGGLRPKEVPFSGFGYIKGKGFHKFRYLKE